MIKTLQHQKLILAINFTLVNYLKISTRIIISEKNKAVWVGSRNYFVGRLEVKQKVLDGGCYI